MTTSATTGDERIRVVLVDDVPDLRFLIASRLRLDPRFEVVGEAGDGHAAIEVTDRERPDVVLLDIAMPGCDGLEALDHIRERSPSTAVVMLSGFPADQVAETAFAKGAVAYVEKGVPLDGIVDALGRALAHSGPEVHRPVTGCPAAHITAFQPGDAEGDR